MWTLVNASYGIAMGQRPTGKDVSLNQRRRRPPTGSAMLNADPRLEAVQVQRRDHLAQAAHEQWMECVVTANHRRPPHKATSRWVQAFWWRLRDAEVIRRLLTHRPQAAAEEF
jgi:hypothetical protein